MHTIVIGLGKMGLALAKNLNQQGYSTVGFDIVKPHYRHDRMTYLTDTAELDQLEGPKTVLLLLPAGEPTRLTLGQLEDRLNSGDSVVDFSNSPFQEAIGHYQRLQKVDVTYYDCGLSGGVKGALEGACMMLGGPGQAPTELLEMLRAICVPGGFSYYGQVGSGHYLKMVHNGIEYAMMQGIAEGLDLLHTQDRYNFDLSQVANNWANGSIIASALMDNIQDELRQDTQLAQHTDRVHASGEGKWMVQEALEQAVPTPTIALSLMQRNASMKEQSYANQVLSAMRYNFGGHREVDG